MLRPPLHGGDFVTPAAINLWQAFQDTADRQPDSTALVFASGDTRFAQLRAYAERCAAWLSSLNLREKAVVALQLSKRLEAYALWLACLRQGLPYVFMDPKNPKVRTDAILAQLKPGLFVTETGAAGTLPAHLAAVVHHLPSDQDAQRWIDSLPLPGVKAATVHGLDPAYVMFTSGSTGEPKGAVIPHQGVLGLMRWAKSLFDASEAPRFSNINPLHFDNSVFDLYCGLMNGAALVPVETAKSSNPVSWVRTLRSGRATVLFGVPTFFQTLDALKLLTPQSLPDARIFIFGGEGYPIGPLKSFHARFMGHARLINVYGPTETSCICSSLMLDEEALAAAGGGFASLGRMHDGFSHAVLDPDGEPVGPGETGELWIGGAHVGLGYFANPQETARRFCQDPRQNDHRSIWYRTGDLVREDAEGLLWFQGRADNQVKVRGYRIELEEIDLAVERIPGVTRAVTVTVPALDGPELRLMFVAERRVDAAEVRLHIEQALPHYMQPASIVQADRLPTNQNGKTDRKAVRAALEVAT
jgi:D-alanine--poly(phosphoribitol) ligase subunit 1